MTNDDPLNVWTRDFVNIIDPNSEYNMGYEDAFNLYEVIGDMDMNFFTYEGSLTTPMCSENVMWIISTKTLAINKREVIQN
jgi:carbonic anhydrase